MNNKIHLLIIGKQQQVWQINTKNERLNAMQEIDKKLREDKKKAKVNNDQAVAGNKHPLQENEQLVDEPPKKKQRVVPN